MRPSILANVPAAIVTGSTVATVETKAEPSNNWIKVGATIGAIGVGVIAATHGGKSTMPYRAAAGGVGAIIGAGIGAGVGWMALAGAATLHSVQSLGES